MTEKSVLIAGAGPNGLMLACELALAGVRPVVLDRLPAPSDEPKANGLVGQVLRQLDMRGLYRRISESPEPPKPLAAWMFSGLSLPLTDVPANPMYAQLISQPRLVRLLYARARELGITVRWGHELIGIDDRVDELLVTVASPDGTYPIAADYVVGADGGRSPVRKLAAIEFPGYTADSVARMGHVQVPESWRTDDGGLNIPGFGTLAFGHTRLNRGGVIYAEFERGRPMLGTVEFGSGSGGLVDDSVPMTVGELRTSLTRVLGVDVAVDEPSGPGPRALRRIAGQNTRQADRYRSGRVLLLGDSAHVHSAMGGPGLNLGLQDAMNLGWKLAATVAGRAPEGLLDTYQSERHPVGERVMMQSLSQTALFSPGAEIGALRELFGELLRIPDVAAHIAGLLAGSDVRYDIGDDHPLSGYLVPDFTLGDGRRVAELLRPGRPVLIGADVGHAGVDVVMSEIVDGPAALLLRPDGYVAWAADDLARPGLRRAFERWFRSGSRGRTP
jgi:2-polyprenyl-6-methoxyphenol hydroxylase-like FAD-dependent oxidoreductase